MLCLVHHHASWHAFRHIKHRIIFIRVVLTRVFGSCRSSFRESDPPVVLVSSTHGVGVKLDFYEN
jgi:hypothetical protein